MLFVGVCISFSSLTAQEKEWINKQRIQKKIIATDSLKIDSLLIIPDRFSVVQNAIPVSPLLYRVDYIGGVIYFEPELHYKEIELTYYTFPLVEEELFAKDTALVQPYYANSDAYTRTTISNKPKLFEGLQSRGSLVRGVSFGNNQGAAVQSSLDLQLNGKLSEEVYINAVIADNNVPIEADGYTQQLQEFDRVYVELYNQNSRIRAGQIDLVQRNDFFGNFAEKVTGLQVETNLVGENGSTRIAAAGSVSRGDFVSSRFTGQEGNQGPYRLSGNNGERFVVVVSGSERVYIDGILLERGADRDYVINYNTGELTFTTNRLITGNQRILVEYIYADRNFSRFLFYSGVEHEREKLQLAAHFYSNGDSRNSPLSAELNEEQQAVLANAGNDRTQMIVPTAQAAEFDSNRNQYRMVEVNGQSVFEYTTDASQPVFNVTFRFVGPGNGDYEPSNIEVNGRVFSYVPPIGGVSQGSFSPTRQLVAPARHQLYTFNGRYKPKANTQIGFDVGLSNEDLNLFSSLDDEQNVGPAARFYAQSKWGQNNWIWEPQITYSYLNRNFRAIQRLRTEEFARDFNLRQEIDTVNQNYIQSEMRVRFKEALRFSYRFDYLDNADQYNGLRNAVQASYIDSTYLFDARASLLQTESNLEKSNFERFLAHAERRLGKKTRVGARWEGENNELNDLNGNALEQSFRWNELRGFVAVGDSASRFARLELYNRRDDSVRLAQLQNISMASGLVLRSKLLQSQKQNLDLNAHLRRIRFGFGDEEDETQLTGNLRYSRNLWERAVQLNAYYELASGREAQREFEYVEVQDGLGIYKWTDYNGDGVRQLDEFELAEFQDQASFIRVFTSTINFIRTQKNQFTFSLSFVPKRIWESALLQRFQLSASLNLGNSLSGNQINWNPFTSQETYLARTRNIRSQLQYLAREGQGWSASYSYQNTVNAFTVFTGLEERFQTQNLLKFGYQPNPEMAFTGEAELSNVGSASEEFAARRFNFDSYRASPAFRYKLAKRINLSVFYAYENKESRTGIETLNQNKAGLDMQWNDEKKSSLAAQFSFVKNDFTGNENSIVGNQMMEGLRRGNNLVWQLQLQRQISNALQINISYNGRKLEESTTIHSGSVQLQVRF